MSGYLKVNIMTVHAFQICHAWVEILSRIIFAKTSFSQFTNFVTELVKQRKTILMLFLLILTYVVLSDYVCSIRWATLIQGSIVYYGPFNFTSKFKEKTHNNFSAPHTARAHAPWINLSKFQLIIINKIKDYIRP